MKVQQFLEHHGILENPFGQEDASTDHVFKQHCLAGTHHPAWDKIYGNPESPATSVVFGEKGSGKTALRLQIVEQLKEHNRENPEKRCFIIQYDDFNPFLDSFRDRLHGRKRRVERALENWRLWDHIDAILSLGVTKLVQSILDVKKDAGEKEEEGDLIEQAKQLPRLKKRDLLLLTAFYDHTFEQTPLARWKALRKKLKFAAWWAQWDFALGILVIAATVALVLKYGGFTKLWSWWAILIYLAACLPWGGRQLNLFWKAWRVKKQIRVFEHLPNALRGILSRFPRQEIAGQPIPSKDRSDDRYELLMKLQSVLKSLGYTSIIVLIDRVDEPHLVNGSPERMRDLVWPMFDNKFLKHPEIGFKLLLPAEVTYFLQREEKQFYERSRLDKQNLVMSLEWTGESLYDIANDRIRACVQSAESAPLIGDLFDTAMTDAELIGIFSRLRVPRHLFKFLHRLLVDHCNHHTDENPSWHISREIVHSTLAVYMRDLEAFERGLGTG